MNNEESQSIITTTQVVRLNEQPDLFLRHLVGQGIVNYNEK